MGVVRGSDWTVTGQARSTRGSIAQHGTDGRTDEAANGQSSEPWCIVACCLDGTEGRGNKCQRTAGHVQHPDRGGCYWLVSHLVSMAVERTTAWRLALIGATKSRCPCCPMLPMGQTASEAKDLQHLVCVLFVIRAGQAPCPAA
jgi:hypothetical protein